MFANTQMMGMDMAFPDVCLTPAGPAVVPIPYPNIAMGPTAIPSQVTVHDHGDAGAQPRHHHAADQRRQCRRRRWAWRPAW